MADIHDRLISWLQDAHAMEEGIVEVLERQEGHAKDWPDLREKIQDHLKVTRSQAERLEECLDRLESGTSSIKSGASNMIGALQGMSTSVADDTVIKDALQMYATEHFEIACYLSLITTAQEAQEDEIVEVLDEILREEEEMAEWVGEHLEDLTTQFLLAEQDEDSA